MRNKVSDLQTKLSHAAKQSLDERFGALYDKIYREDVVLEAWKRVKANKGAPGVDRQDFEYIEDVIGVDRFLLEVREQLKSELYKPQPVLRCYIDKPGKAEKRPLGIPVIIDRVCQMATKLVLEPIFETNFLDCSHGFRPERSAHDAVRIIGRTITFKGQHIVLDADITGFFDNIDHGLLQEFIRRRVIDGGILRLIGKWLNAGVFESGEISYPERGTPQGGVVSPVLSNIFLHYVLDDWFVEQVKPRMKGRCFLIRFADDFIIGCEPESDARRIMEVLPKRFDRYGLALHPDKTAMIPFKRPSRTSRSRKGSRTFDFLGFTFYWSISRRGYWVIKKKTASKRLSRFMKRVWQWCRENRHEPLKEQHQALCSKLRGHFQYYGVRGNFRALEVVFEFTKKAWRFWLSRRSHKGGISWDKFDNIRTSYPFPKPRIVHSI